MTADRRSFRLSKSILVEPSRQQVVRDGVVLPLEPRVMDLLGYFAAHPQRIISKRELMQEVWRTNVVDEAIHRAISLLRSALGDTPQHSSILETVPRQGYRLLAHPRLVAERNGIRDPRLWAALVLVAMIAIVVVWDQRSEPPAPQPSMSMPAGAAPAESSDASSAKPAPAPIAPLRPRASADSSAAERGPTPTATAPRAELSGPGATPAARAPEAPGSAPLPPSN